MICIFHKWEEKEKIDNGPIEFPMLNAALFGATIKVCYEECLACGKRRREYGIIDLPSEGAVLKPMQLDECEISA